MQVRPILDEPGSRICVDSNLRHLLNETQTRSKWAENRWERDQPWRGGGCIFFQAWLQKQGYE